MSSELGWSIPGVALGTDRDISGVGRSGRDSDLIVPLTGLPKAPDGAVPMSQGCSLSLLLFWALLTAARPLPVVPLC